jgi:hypothetical protein
MQDDKRDINNTQYILIHALFRPDLNISGASKYIPRFKREIFLSYVFSSVVSFSINTILWLNFLMVKGKGKSKVVPVLNLVPRHEDVTITLLSTMQ